MKKILLFILMYCFSHSFIHAQETFTNRIKTTNHEYANNVRRSANGDYLAPMVSSDSGFYVSRVNEKGKILWQKIYGKHAQIVSVLSAFPDNGFVIFGNIFNDKLNANTPSIIRCDSLGNIIWSKSFEYSDNNFFSYPSKIIVDSKGNILLLTQLIQTNGPLDQIRILKLDSSGNITGRLGLSNIYSAAYQGLNLNSFSVTNNSGYLIGLSYSSAFAEGEPIGYLLQIDKSGNVISYKHTGPYSISFDDIDFPFLIKEENNQYKILGYFSKYNDDNTRTNYYYIATINNNTISAAAKLIPYNSFALQRYLRENNSKITFENGNIISKSEITVFGNFNTGNTTYNYTEIRHYDSSGKICPDYTLPVYSYDTTSTAFIVGSEINGVKKVFDSISVTDGGIGQRTVHYMKEICAGEAATFSKNDALQNAVLATTSAGLFPNPAHNKVTVSVPSFSKQTQISLFNGNGQLLQSFPLYTKNPILNIETYPKGIYVVKISTTNQIQILKFIKE